MEINKLTGIIPDRVLLELPELITTFSINTPRRLAHFLAQCAHESGNFKLTTENLNYGMNGLRTVFKRHFPTEVLAMQYARKPERIANLVYANRMGNGPESSGDGWKYRGRGYIQLTGKVNYQAFDGYVPENILDQPDLVATKYPLLSAGWFWHTRKLNTLADTGGESVVPTITRRVNGGTNGLEDRILKFKKYNIL